MNVEQETIGFIKKHKKMLIMSLTITIGMCTLNHIKPELFAHNEPVAQEEHEPVVEMVAEEPESETVEEPVEKEENGLGMKALKFKHIVFFTNVLLHSF